MLAGGAGAACLFPPHHSRDFCPQPYRAYCLTGVLDWLTKTGFKLVMFYSVDLSRKAKTPIARLWQAAHSMKLNKKIAKDFDIDGESEEAPVQGLLVVRA